jgi:hypothetical protein
MKARAAIATAAVLVVVLGAGWASAAEGIAGRFAIAGSVGTQTELGGDLLANGQGTLVGLPLTFESVGYRDVFGPDVRVQGFIGYGVSAKVELVLRGGWYKSAGTGVSAGSFAGSDTFAYFTDYEEWGLELAARYYVAHRTRLKSWIAPVVGLRATNNLYVSYSIPEAGSAVLNVPFNEESTVPVFGLDIGVSFDLTDNLFIGLDSGLRYQGPSADANALPGIGTVDDSEGRWTAPVMLSLGVRF